MVTAVGAAIVVVVLAGGLTAARTLSPNAARQGLAAAGADDGVTSAVESDAVPGGEPAPTLRPGIPEEAGLAGGPLAGVTDALERATAGGAPVAAGAVALVAKDGVIALHEARGYALRFADRAGNELPADQQVAAAPDTVFDIASLSKLLTAVAVLQLVDDGRVDLDQPVATVVPRFAAGGKDAVTVRQLLAHTSGLPAGLPPGETTGSRAERLDAAVTAELVAEPGATRRYSDVGYIVLGELVETVTDQRLDEVVAARITEPLGMGDTAYNPPDELRPRIAATEDLDWDGRGLVRGSVHDPNAWGLDGVAGHAGAFSTASDMAVLAQTLLAGGRYGTVQILSEGMVEQMMAEQLADVGQRGQGLGLIRGDERFMGQMAYPDTVGHTGFTGTSLVVDPHAGAFVVLLTNRVHPTADGPGINPLRREVAGAVARALAECR